MVMSDSCHCQYVTGRHKCLAIPIVKVGSGWGSPSISDVSTNSGGRLAHDPYMHSDLVDPAGSYVDTGDFWRFSRSDSMWNSGALSLITPFLAPNNICLSPDNPRSQVIEEPGEWRR